MTATPIPAPGTIPPGRPVPTGLPVADAFVPVLAFTLNEEGIWSDDPDDAGGPTHFGITLTTFRELYQMPSLTVADLKAMSIQTATAIYRNWFWRKPNFHLLPVGVSLVVFDYGVNAGPGTTARCLQNCLGVGTDGLVGPVTIKAAFGQDAKSLIARLTEAHQAHYRTLPRFNKYGEGWMGRAERARAAAYALVPPSMPKVT